MRIGITCYPTYGGSGIVATELGLELALRGHEVHFITYANPIRLDPGTPGIHYHEVEVSNYPLFQYPPYSLALASRMAEVAESRRLDLLHVHYAIPHSISAFLAQQMTTKRYLPFVTTLHGTDITLVGSDRSYFPITKFSIERSDGITTISEYMRRRTIDFFGVQKEIEVIHNFVNCELIGPMSKLAIGPSASCIFRTSGPSSACSIASSRSHECAAKWTLSSLWLAMGRPWSRRSLGPRSRLGGPCPVLRQAGPYGEIDPAHACSPFAE